MHAQSCMEARVHMGGGGGTALVTLSCLMYLDTNTV